MIPIELEFSVWATIVSDNGITSVRHTFEGRSRTYEEHEFVRVYAGNQYGVYATRVARDSADWTTWDSDWRADEQLLGGTEACLASLIGYQPPPKFTADGDQRIVVEPRPGSEKYFYTHNLCDPSSWFEGAVQVTSAAGTDSGDLTTWTFAHENFIDLRHGRVFKEDQIPTRATYDILVEVDTGSGWEAKVENTFGIDPVTHEPYADNDYDFDYEAGAVTFNSALPGGAQVRVSGYKADSSTYVVVPEAGKRLKLEYVEVQYTQDIEMYSNVVFEIYGYVDVFAPAMMGPPYNIPSGTKIPLVAETYKRLFDFFQESTGPFPVIPPHGGDWIYETVTGVAALQEKVNSHVWYEKVADRYTGSDWEFVIRRMDSPRGVSAPVITIPFQYLAFRDIRSSYGMEIRVSLENDIPVTGDFATVTFYCTTEAE